MSKTSKTFLIHSAENGELSVFSCIPKKMDINPFWKRLEMDINPFWKAIYYYLLKIIKICIPFDLRIYPKEIKIQTMINLSS